MGEDLAALLNSVEEVQEAIGSLLRKSKFVSIATYGLRIWNISTSYWAEDFDFYCLAQDLSTLDNLRHNPRVSFTILDEEHNSTLQGSAIARIIGKSSDSYNDIEQMRLFKELPIGKDEQGQIVKITPYRFAISNNNRQSRESIIIEKHKLQWKIITKEQDSLNKNSLKSQIQFWIGASRAVTLALSALPIAIGSVVAAIQGQFNVWLFLAAILGGILAHIGANLISDYFDFKKGVDTTAALSSHPGALINEMIEPEKILIGAFLAFMGTVFAGGILLAKVGWPLIWFGIIGIAGGLLYTGGSVSYKYRGLGELMISILMGPLMVLGAYYVQTQSITLLPFLISLPIGLLVGSVSLANNIRDTVDDRKSGIVTLPMLLGVRNSKTLYYLATFLPYIISALVIVLKPEFYPISLIIFSLPLAFKAVNAFRKTKDSAEDIRARARELMYPLNSIKLHLRFGLLLLTGCLLVVFLT